LCDVRRDTTVPALGHKQTFATPAGMSALPQKADVRGAKTDVRFGPKADIQEFGSR